MVLADNLQGLEKNFNDLLCPVLKGFVMGKARYPRYFEDFQFSDEKDASKMLSEIVSRGADEKVTTGDSFLRTFFKVIKGGIGEGAIRTCFCTVVSMLGFDHEEASEYLRYVMCVPNETMQTIARYVL